MRPPLAQLQDGILDQLLVAVVDRTNEIGDLNEDSLSSVRGGLLGLLRSSLDALGSRRRLGWDRIVRHGSKITPSSLPASPGGARHDLSATVAVRSGAGEVAARVQPRSQIDRSKAANSPGRVRPLRGIPGARGWLGYVRRHTRLIRTVRAGSTAVPSLEIGAELIKALLVGILLFLIATFPATFLLMLFLGNVHLNLSYWGTFPLGILASMLIGAAGSQYG